VGVMKGVILSILPDVQLMDITHEIPPQDVLEGAFVIGEVYRFYPARTIHVIVVDPGVGTTRRPLLVEAGDQFFIAPDNGVLSMLYEKDPSSTVRQITADRYFLKPVSATFHGRDIFAPVAAWLAKTGNVASFGEPTTNFVRLPLHKPVRAGSRVTGTILRADQFGNLLTNFTAQDLPEVLSGAASFRIVLGAVQITRQVNTFADGAVGEPVILLGSSGYFEIVINRGSAARTLGIQRGNEVLVELGPPPNPNDDVDGGKNGGTEAHSYHNSRNMGRSRHD
jgi:S-adenosyl-L-methionine hydrolase (adenosine-forming)